MTKNHPYPSTDHYRYQFPLCMSPTPQITPKMRKVEKDLCNHGTRAMYREDSGFLGSLFDSPCSAQWIIVPGRASDGGSWNVLGATRDAQPIAAFFG